MKPYIATDLIIRYNYDGKNGIVLVERKNPPFGLALPGGFAEYGLSLEDNARKESKEETDLDVILDSPERPFCVHSGIQRDPRGHVISVTYTCEGRGDLKAGDDALHAKVYTVPELDELVYREKLVFDHARILSKYLRSIR